jgi:hypothetical protein
VISESTLSAGPVANDVGATSTYIRSLAPAEAPVRVAAADRARVELCNLLTAAALYEGARATCQAKGLAQDEVTVVMALGWICATVGAREQAAHAYGEAAVLAERKCLLRDYEIARPASAPVMKARFGTTRTEGGIWIELRARRAEARAVTMGADASL